MNIRQIALVGAIAIVSPLSFAQGAGDGGGTTGGSAGDGDRPLTYTRKDFAELDKNKDRILDKKEILASQLEGALVKKIDTNGDGLISQAEFDAYQSMTEGNKVPKK